MLTQIVFIHQVLIAPGRHRGLIASVSSAIFATCSSTAAWYTASSASLPQANGPWFFTSMAGTLQHIPYPARDSMITAPVFFSYAVSISSCVSARAQGTSPWKVIRVRGAVGGHRAPCLREGRGIGGMRVHDAADLRERPCTVPRASGVIGRRLPLYRRPHSRPDRPPPYPRRSCRRNPARLA